MEFRASSYNEHIINSSRSLTDDVILEARVCYCYLWNDAKASKWRKQLKVAGIERGYCGECELCGGLGHVCHYPGPVPYTGSWCDSCYVMESRKSLFKKWEWFSN